MDSAPAVSYTPIMAPDNRGIKRRPGKQPAREGERRLRVMYSRARSSLLEATKQKINQYSLYFSFYILSVNDFNSTNVS